MSHKTAKNREIPVYDREIPDKTVECVIAFPTRPAIPKPFYCINRINGINRKRFIRFIPFIRCFLRFWVCLVLLSEPQNCEKNV